MQVVEKRTRKKYSVLRRARHCHLSRPRGRSHPWKLRPRASLRAARALTPLPSLHLVARRRRRRDVAGAHRLEHLVDLLGACSIVDGAWAARAAILKKRFQNCDWRRRPLSSDQVDYARGDATHLLALDAALWTRLAESPELERAAFADSQAAPARALWRPPRASWLGLLPDRGR